MSRHHGNRRAPAEHGGHLARSSNLERDILCEHEVVVLQDWKLYYTRSTRGGGSGTMEMDVVVEGDGFTLECTGRARPTDFTL